jgi:enoyl-CoA hydratase/carnithine racemase
MIALPRLAGSFSDRACSGAAQAAQHFLAAGHASEIVEMLAEYVRAAEDICAECAVAATDAAAATRAAVVANMRQMVPYATACAAASPGSELSVQLLQLICGNGDPLDTAHTQVRVRVRGAGR